MRHRNDIGVGNIAVIGIAIWLTSQGQMDQWTAVLFVLLALNFRIKW